ncbi:SDR family NAD(P)-dependent oxidoreductase [Sporosarcina sp. G11-34]|uniref:SDR family NAD(P)-dependent oxidoreductase n=1 Tax=Sporosarcina sp. G11-34 TaxID=2849605 RepID=UPI0022A9BAB1|nr:SDR family NAD(P)-dependent oxidoreductase [Sporosarcina sp. G11-34]MCZ2259689.1 SDR family NAD(P)-dependent oxidoreductase [Sporosarcina sp. G11-34]
MDIVIVTGASKGIGFEISQQLEAKGKKVIGIARTMPEDRAGFVSADLSDTDCLENLITSIIDEHIEIATSFTLINNAGIVDPIGLIGSVQAEVIAKAIAVNLTAPMLITNAFISRLENFENKKRIVNISSGAGRNAYEGWGTYCTTKAGLDHFSRVVALEQATAKYPIEIVAIAPGIIDTGMQETIRASGADAFPLLDRFIDYKEKGLLSSAEETAQKLIAFMENEDFKAVGPIVDIRDY